jgi:predicted acyl esterase
MRPTTAIILSLLIVVACDDDDDAKTGNKPGADTTHDDADASGSHDKSDAQVEPTRVSKPGEYKGYSEPLYKDGYELSSQYVKVRDGTQLAADLYRPKDANGKAVTKPLPVLWMHSPYNRRYFTSATTGQGLSGENYPGAAARLVEYGYVVAIVDFRGLYASYGTNVAYNRGEYIDAAHLDAYDITEWLAEQPWSTGNIGMWGCSATGESQLQAASTAPPHLKAIFPMSCAFDAYTFAVAGGMSPPRGTATSMPPATTAAEDRDKAAEPVDGDDDRSKLNAAIGDHKAGVENAGYIAFRDSVAENFHEQWWIKSSPQTYLDKLNQSGAAIYLAANWDEGTSKYGAFFTFNNVTNPVKLVIGPATHCAWFTVENTTGFKISTEELRFFDHWLKGVDNGVMDEPRVYYYTYNAPEGTEWRSSDQWPLAEEKRTAYYLGGSKTLSVVPPASKDTHDEREVDYDVSATDNLADKGLVYDSPLLGSDVQVTGHPVVDIWVSTTATDGDFIATLFDVAPDGTTTSYNTNGRLRASLRQEADAPYNNLGLPWHRSNAEDAAPLVPNEPTELKFDVLPLSIVFQKNHIIRLVLTFAVKGTTPTVSPAPKITLYRDATHRSSITLPIIRHEK